MASNMGEKLTRLRDFLLRKKLFSGSLLVLLIALLGSVSWAYFTNKLPFPSFQSVKGLSRSTIPEVNAPTIINGELILPKPEDAPTNTLAQFGENSRLAVENAILMPIREQDKLVAIRMLGEMRNRGQETIDGVSPIVRFFDASGKVVGQKLAEPSDAFKFFSLESGGKTIYDFTVKDPPESEKIEIMVNVSSSTASAAFEPLKIASRSMEIKTANTQGSPQSTSSDSASASDSASQQVEYFIVSGSVFNTESDPYSEITIYSWAKAEDGRVLAFEKQEFKNDLLISGNQLDFKITLLPLRLDSKMQTYEIAAWGKRYKLDLPH